MVTLRSILLRMGFLLALLPAATPARAEDFPTRPVKIIVQTAAGSSLDVMARLVAEQLSQIWGQQAIIINQAGAGGFIASRMLAASDPDGYTLFLAGGSVFVILPEIQRDLPFDVGSFVPIGFVAEQPYGLLVSKTLGVNSFAELLTKAKESQGGLDAVAGTLGGLQHMTAELFKSRGLNINMIHYPGTAQALNDIITGRVPVAFQTLLPVAGVVSSGQIKLIAVAAPERLATYPDIPTASETVPGLVSSGWSILVAPHGTPPAIVQKINADLRMALARPQLIKKFEEQGNFTRSLTPQALAEFVKSERDLWRPIVKQIGVK